MDELLMYNILQIPRALSKERQEFLGTQAQNRTTHFIHPTSL